MRARLFIAPVAGAFAMIAFACSSTSAPPDANVTEFCTDWAAAYCQLSASCEFDLSSCEAYENTTVCANFVAAAQASGSRVYSQPNGKACIDALNAAFGGSQPPTGVSAAMLATLQDTCNRAFTGNQASDKPCTSTYDCATGLVCSAILGETSEVCATVTTKSINDICGDPGDQCQGDSYCAPVVGAAPECIATPALGGACSATVPCGTENRCVEGICATRALLGQSCASNADCASTAPYCDTYPPAACTNGLTFARGSIDCEGISGNDSTVTPADASVTPTNDDASTTPDTGTSVATDAASGG